MYDRIAASQVASDLHALIQQKQRAPTPQEVRKVRRQFAELVRELECYENILNAGSTGEATRTLLDNIYGEAVGAYTATMLDVK